jgi:glutamate synthase (NADPH/NADH) small chain
MFIRQISTGLPDVAAKTIFDSNILGGVCARVCPVENLCEGACVREAAEGEPVQIGRLQRFATDHLMAAGTHPYTRPASTGKRIAVIGAGPAGFAAAHRLAMHGHDVHILEARPKLGGLNEYGIAAYKVVDEFAQKEVEWLLSIGGITTECGKALGRDFTIESLLADYDAVFLGVGLGGNRTLGIEGEDTEGVLPATEFIEELRQAKALDKQPIGRRVVVIGGGMTSIDAAVQSKLLGAEIVTLVYRRSQTDMPASLYEQNLALSKGVHMIFCAKPLSIHKTKDGIEVKFASAESNDFSIFADQVFTAIGQLLAALPTEIKTEGGKIKIDKNHKTSLDRVWAGGDCTDLGDDLTVTAVAHGRDAAMSIHATLTKKT